MKTHQLEARIAFPEVYTAEGETLHLIANAISNLYVASAGEALKGEMTDTVMGAAVTTELDRKLYDAAEGVINVRHSGDVVISEERSLPRAGRRNWMIDPLDGSTARYRGLPGGFCTSVAFIEEEEVKAALVHDPFSVDFFIGVIGRTWIAELGRGTFLNGRRLPPREDTVAFEQAFLALQRIRTPDLPESLLLDPFWENLWTRRHSYTTHTSQVLAFMETITGHYDGAVANQGARPWDFAAAMLIASETGGLEMTDLTRGKLNPLVRPNGVVVAPPTIHREITRRATIALQE